jgi:hypothetical protein
LLDTTLALSCLPSDSPARERIEISLLGVGKEAAKVRDEELKRRQQSDIEGFERLCEEITTDLSKALSPAVVHATAEIDVCKQARRRYEKTVLPWLSIIRAAHSEASPHSLRARTAAARCLLGIAERFRYCGDRCKALDLLAPAAELAPAGSETASEIARQRSHLYRESSSRPTPEASLEADRAGSVDGFVALCNSIIVELQQFQRGPGPRNSGGTLLGLMAEHEDYRRRASPWLAVILRSYDGEMPARAGNAAARCLSCLAGGFISVHDWDTAQALARQALPLIEDEKLEAEVRRQLANIAFQKQKPAPKPASADHWKNAGRSGAAGNRTFTLWVPEILTFVFVGAVVLAAILAFTKSNEPRSSALTVSQAKSLARPSPAPADFARLTLEGQLDALQRASPQDKQRLKPIFRERFNRDIGKVPDEEQELFFRKMAAAGLVDAALPANPPGVYAPSELSDKPPANAPAARTPLTFDASEVNADQTHRAANTPKGPAATDYTALLKKNGGVAADGEKTSGTLALVGKPTPIDWAKYGAVPVAVSLPNGTELISPPPSEASSELRISNYTKQDAVVKLKAAANKETLRSVYVRAMSDFTIPKIVAGVYLVDFATGMDWDETSRSFRQDRGFARFDNPLAFSEDNARYSANSITLHTVLNGNARKETISAEEFGDDTGTGGVKRPRR